MIKIKPTVNKKVLEPKEIETKVKPKKKSEGGMSDKDKNKKVIPLMPQGVIYKGKAKDYPGIKKIIKDKYKKSEGGSMESEGPLRQRATYGQRSKQKVFERKQKIMKRAKGGSTEFGMLSVKAGIDKNPNPTAADRIAGAKMNKKSKGGEMKKGYGAARQSGMGLEDENLTPGKTMDYYKDLI
jgi:hypothetical protein